MDQEDFRRIARNRLRTTPGATLNVAELERDGSNFGNLIAGAAAMAEECDSQSQGRFAALLSSSASDTDLDTIVIEETFGELPRKGASAATMVGLISRPKNSAITPPSVFLPAGTQVSVGSLVFTTDIGIPFAAGQLVVGNGSVSLTCTTAGSAGNLAPGALSGFKSPGSLPDVTLTIVPFAPDSTGYATGGAERENDADYRSRLAIYGAGQDEDGARLQSAALAVPGITFAAVVEELDSAGAPTGVVSLYVGDVNGRANTALLALVRAALRGARMPGQDVEIVGAVPVLTPIIVHVGTTTGFSSDVVRTAVSAAVVASVNGLQPGAPLLLTNLAVAIQGVPGAILEATYPLGVVSPSLDQFPTKSQLFRTSSDLVTFQ